MPSLVGYLDNKIGELRIKLIVHTQQGDGLMEVLAVLSRRYCRASSGKPITTESVMVSIYTSKVVQAPENFGIMQRA